MQSYNNIPNILKQLPQWVCFRLEPKDKKGNFDKIPYNPKTGYKAKANDPTTWCDYQTAVNGVLNSEYDGIGFEFSNGIFGIDLDHVIDDSDKLTDEALDIVGTMDSYTELSPSKTGLHILCKGSIPDKDRRKGNIEMYSKGRYFTVTGEIYGEKKVCEERTEQAKAVHDKYLKREKQDKPKEPGAKRTLVLSDDAVIIKASEAKNGEKFNKLWQGDTTDYIGDDSAADLALCNYLAFWTNGNAVQMDRLFRQSGLMRDKWNEKRGQDTYGKITIDKTLASFIQGASNSLSGLNGNISKSELCDREYIITDSKGEYKVAVPLLADYLKRNMKYIFARSDAKAGVQRYIYKDGAYRHVSDDEFKGYIKKEIPLELQQPNTVNNVFTALSQETDCYTAIDKLNTDENIINFQNGILCLDTMTLRPHTPDILSTIQIPCNYNPNVKKPVNCVFDRFITHLCHDDGTRVLFLLEFMGVALSNIPGYRMKKALFMKGDGDTGKSQCKELMNLLVGSEYYANIDLDDLEERFGASALYGKRIAGSNDMKYATIGELKIFKQLTGGDSINTEYKGEGRFNFKYPGVLWFCMNELPRFGGDRGKWVYDRIIILECNNPVQNKDPLLLDKMYEEREYIVNECLKVLKKVIENGYAYDIPECCKQAVAKYTIGNDSVLCFLNECTEERKTNSYKGNETTGAIYRVYKDWCKNNVTRGYCETMPGFRKVLQAKGIDETQKSGGNHYFTKFKLTDEAKHEFCVCDNGI